MASSCFLCLAQSIADKEVTGYREAILNIVGQGERD